jgi:phosphate transport system substrate-binding protein
MRDRHERVIRRALLVLAPVLIAGIAACGGTTTGGNLSASSTPDPDLSTPTASLMGAGSSFDNPFFMRAFAKYNTLNANVTVNYNPVGSGTGVTQFEQQLVDFGATDVPMNATDIGKAIGGAVVQVPVTIGGVAVAYNLPGISNLKLTSDVLVKIFLGQITAWNDPAITALNAGVSLPDPGTTPLTTVHRGDSSGTTYIFTDYLSNVSPTWKAGPGKGKKVSWPGSNALDGQQNGGVAGKIHGLPGTIGYVELAYALQNNFQVVSLQNRDGNYVTPSIDSVKAAASQKPNVSASDFSIVNEPGSNSYPIAGYSWVVVYQKQTSADKGTAMIRLLDWLTHSGGQTEAQALEYVPLPSGIQDLARASLKMVVGPSGTAILS